MSVAAGDKKQMLLEGINDLCQKLYQECGRSIKPRYPWVLVKVLPKIQKAFGLEMPAAQNKIFYEGLVLETWDNFCITINDTHEDGRTIKHQQVMESRLKPGDHVVFPHFEGLPVGDMLDEHEFRLVHEVNSHDMEGRCEIMAKMEYQSEPVRDQLLDMVYATRESNEPDEEIVNGIVKRFILVPRSIEAKSVSGK
jgi:hypothetical protein